MTAEELLKSADPAAALKALTADIRSRPSDAKLRVFIAQLLCVLGQWERALNQLTVAAELDALAVPMKQVYGDAILCERLRAEVFAGKRTPMIFGQPDEWLALLVESLLRAGAGDAQAAESLRQRAFDAAPGSAGRIDGTPFEWLADADMRLGPVLEAFINGRYYWVPFARLSQVRIEAPEDLRDCVWTPAHLQFSNGGESLALVPTRYQGTESSGDGALLLARRTEWREAAPDVWCGLGQRLFGSDVGEHALMDAREIDFDAAEAGPEAPAAEPVVIERTDVQERLQPSLLDRLVDHAPHDQRESDDKRTLTRQGLRQSVLRDLSWLFNATAHGLQMDDRRYPHAARSVLNYGLPMLSGQFTSSIQRVSMEQALKNAIQLFEPRILPRTLEVELIMEGSALDSHNRIGLQIRGMLWAQPVPLEFLMRSRIDLEEGRVELEDIAQPSKR